ncbi:MAG TPA: AAA family ATPase, partial [Bacilli bacterium]
TGNLDMLLEEWELQEARKKEFRKLSKGMKQKALLMQALYSDADILFFDEPLNGIDRHSAEKFVKKLAELKAKDKTIILSSHNPEFFQNLADKTVRMEVPE